MRKWFKLASWGMLIEAEAEASPSEARLVKLKEKTPRTPPNSRRRKSEELSHVTSEVWTYLSSAVRQAADATTETVYWLKPK